MKKGGRCWRELEKRGLNQPAGPLDPVSELIRTAGKIVYAQGSNARDANDRLTSAVGSQRETLVKVRGHFDKWEKQLNDLSGGRVIANGTEEEKLECWRDHVATYEAVKREHPIWGKGACYEEAAQRRSAALGRKVSYKAIWRALKRLK